MDLLPCYRCGHPQPTAPPTIECFTTCKEIGHRQAHFDGQTWMQAQNTAGDKCEPRWDHRSDHYASMSWLGVSERLCGIVRSVDKMPQPYVAFLVATGSFLPSDRRIRTLQMTRSRLAGKSLKASCEWESSGNDQRRVLFWRAP